MLKKVPHQRDSFDRVERLVFNDSFRPQCLVEQLPVDSPGISVGHDYGGRVKAETVAEYHCRVTRVLQQL